MTKANETHDMLTAVLTKIDSLETVVAAMSMNVEKMVKYINKQAKETRKANGKTKEKKAGVFGFEIPIPVSDSLSSFIGIPKGELISRVQATKKITEYVKGNSLQSKENGRVIIPDAKLESLLEAKGELVTWFTLQKYLKKHFMKKIVL
jgi:chromatin remodeling complex protein RSC6